MSTNEKRAKAKELRAEGWKAREIAIRLDAPESTIRNWYLGGECIDCGAHVNPEAERCCDCSPLAQTIWNRETVVEKVREWNALYGRPPAAYDWNPAQYNRHSVSEARALEVQGRFKADHWPTASTVQNKFGSWSAGIEAAGFAPLERSGGRRQAVAA